MLLLFLTHSAAAIFKFPHCGTNERTLILNIIMVMILDFHPLNPTHSTFSKKKNLQEGTNDDESVANTSEYCGTCVHKLDLLILHDY